MNIKCDHCGAVAETIEPKEAADGEFEYTFFRCPACKATFPIAVTDKRLRVDITEYQHRRNHIRISPVSEQFLRETEALKQENLKRCRELMEQHPLLRQRHGWMKKWGLPRRRLLARHPEEVRDEQYSAEGDSL